MFTQELNLILIYAVVGSTSFDNVINWVTSSPSLYVNAFHSDRLFAAVLMHVLLYE